MCRRGKPSSASRERWWRLNPFHRPPFVSWCRGPSPSAVDIQRAIAWSIREIFLFANCAVQAAATRRGGSEVLPCCRQFVSLSSPSPRQSPRGDEWEPDSAQSICGLPPPQTAVGTQPQHGCACGVEMMCGCQCFTRGRKPFFSARNNLHSLIPCRIGTTRPPLPATRYGANRGWGHVVGNVCSCSFKTEKCEVISRHWRSTPSSAYFVGWP